MSQTPTRLEILNALSAAQLDVRESRHSAVLGWLWASHAFAGAMSHDEMRKAVEILGAENIVTAPAPLSPREPAA